MAFTLPPVPPGKKGWHRAVDTSLPAGRDVAVPGSEERISSEAYAVAARTMTVFLSK